MRWCHARHGSHPPHAHPPAPPKTLTTGLHAGFSCVDRYTLVEISWNVHEVNGGGGSRRHRHHALSPLLLLLSTHPCGRHCRPRSSRPLCLESRFRRHLGCARRLFASRALACRRASPRHRLFQWRLALTACWRGGRAPPAPGLAESRPPSPQSRPTGWRHRPSFSASSRSCGRRRSPRGRIGP